MIDKLQYFCRISDLAEICGVSKQTIYRMIEEGVLKEGVHFKPFREDGHPMFYIPKVIETLKPDNAPLYMQVG